MVLLVDSYPPSSLVWWWDYCIGLTTEGKVCPCSVWKKEIPLRVPRHSKQSRIWGDGYSKGPNFSWPFVLPKARPAWNCSMGRLRLHPWQGTSMAYNRHNWAQGCHLKAQCFPRREVLDPKPQKQRNDVMPGEQKSIGGSLQKNCSD